MTYDILLTIIIIPASQAIITFQSKFKIIPMKNLKKSFPFFATVVLFGALMTSCGGSHQAGCPGKDRPSYRGYGMTEPAMNNFQTLPAAEKANDKICLSDANTGI